MYDLSISIVQADLAWKNKQDNFDKFEQLFDGMKERTDLIILPEMFNTGFVSEPQDIAEELDGITMQWMRVQAAKYNCVVAGSFAINYEGKYYNCLIWMQPDGKYGYYNKRHLFRMGNEQDQYTAGTEKLVVELLGWKVCPLVCYDLRFPVWSKNRFIENQYEYDLLLYVANWPSARQFVFRQLLIARAIENQSYLAGVNRVGTDGKGNYHQGGSVVLDFKGNQMLEIAPDQEGVETIRLSKQQLTDFRQSFAVGMDWDEFSIKL